ncbi:MAG: UDP-glucose 4-epimerase GalE [Candidatus Krumholzibacteria bacterium]|jgi:UDP-glucose 4-epimerase|nr:UDP-glucose 4-epimerase GalE [Candidatus Krumholzibacteria bacterium]MDP6670030.1 UDP-glucose 4-epimerase GalE [Candidatus Krumholzibacteria bacterium]MDP6797710.1 UDP-glucose 4-epimerase GalE [Candidatus Krumholzibacteria bacterium]MDP7022604.1 UDP-glucose 4-epimerase GalE [Candidatus Krumholzibacteria bacterium]
MRLLVTGGAGYIGGAFLRAALASGHEVAVLDNLSTGHRDSLPPEVRFVEGELRDRSLLDEVLASSDAVVHFAALSIVSDSISDPLRYYRENVGGFLVLLEALADSSVRRFLFSSSAAVYGQGEGRPFREGDPCEPVNPYGGTKLAIEQILGQVAPSLGLSYLCLRYFNAAGALGDHGERHDPETHLIPLALEAALGLRTLKVFGTDYPTPDGTCIRDYIHIEDLAEAHLAGLEALEQGRSGVLNLGTGKGHSVREVLAAVRKISGRELPFEETGRREGDPALLVAAADRAEEWLGWKARRPSLESIVQSAWDFRKKL